MRTLKRRFTRPKGRQTTTTTKRKQKKTAKRSPKKCGTRVGKLRMMTLILIKSGPVAEPLSSEPEYTSEIGSRDLLRIYLREISQYRLITPREEVELARRIKRRDRKAREALIKANLRFVVKLARDYEGLGLPLLDLINEGNIGLMMAVKKFNPRKGGKFTTYSAWWIKQKIRHALSNQSKTIRLPVHMVDRLAAIRKMSMKLQETLGREPTPAEIGAAFKKKISEKRMLRYLQAGLAPVSIDAPLDGVDGDANSFEEIIADESAPIPSEGSDAGILHSLVHKMLGCLPVREAEIMRARYGFNQSQEEQTLKEVGDRYGITRERTRQIQEEILKKFRKMLRHFEDTGTIDGWNEKPHEIIELLKRMREEQEAEALAA